MDLNQLLHRHQVSLMRADSATSPEERRAHDQFTRDYAARISSVRSKLGATDALRGSRMNDPRSAGSRAVDGSDRRTKIFLSAAGRVVLTPQGEMPYKVVLTDAEESTEHTFATMRECEIFIRANTPTPPARCTLYDRNPQEASDDVLSHSHRRQIHSDSATERHPSFR